MPKNGIRFACHNHDYSFYALNGQVPQDMLMVETDDDLVDFKMDIYWVVTAGQDSLSWVKKYPNRFKLLHVKDRMKGLVRIIKMLLLHWALEASTSPKS